MQCKVQTSKTAIFSRCHFTKQCIDEHKGLNIPCCFCCGSCLRQFGPQSSDNQCSVQILSFVLSLRKSSHILYGWTHLFCVREANAFSSRHLFQPIISLQPGCNFVEKPEGYASNVKMKIRYERQRYPNQKGGQYHTLTTTAATVELTEVSISSSES